MALGKRLRRGKPGIGVGRTTFPYWSDEAILRDVAAQNGVDRPFDDPGELIARVLGRLGRDGRLSREADEVRMAAPFEEGGLRARLEAAHRALARSESSIQLLEGEWEVEGEEGDLLLARADVRVVDRPGGAPRSLPLPAGVAIHVRLDGKLTRHGKSAMLGVTQPIRACVIGTVRQHEPIAGCLEITPIAVFQRG